VALGDWTTAYNAQPDGAVDLGSVLDDELNTLKALIRERAAKELNWGTASFETGYSDTGRANPGSARAYFQSASPTGLRRPDNSANQTATTLTGAGDQGRLWVATGNGNALFVLNAAGTFEQVRAFGVPITQVDTTSADSSAIADGGSTTTLGSWGTALTVTHPASGSNDLIIEASIEIANSTATDRYVRVTMHRTAPSAVSLMTRELIVPQRVSATLHGRVTFHFYHRTAAASLAASTAYTYAFVAEANSTGVIFGGGGAAQLTGDGAASFAHRAHLYLKGV
jgi:hypothetical protein